MKRFFVITGCLVAGVLAVTQVQLAQVKVGTPVKVPAVKPAPVPATKPAMAQKDLATLVQAGEAKLALEQIQAGANVNQRQPDGSTPLLWAVNRADVDVAEALLTKKADPNIGNEFGAMPLTEAARQSSLHLVQLLLNAGAKVDTADPDGETALMVAIKGGNQEVVKLLIDKGANVNNVEKFHNQTPLMYASSEGRAEMVKLLLSKGADVKPHSLYSDWPSQITSEPRWQFRSVGGLTALLYASRGGCYQCAEMLIQAGANVNDPTPEGVTPLLTALDNTHNDIAKLLMDKHANINTWDWWGRTPLWIAVARKAAPAGAGGGGGGGRGGRGGGGGGAAIPAPGAAAGAGARGGAGGGRGGGRAGGGGAAAVVVAGPAVSSMEIINALLDAGANVNVEMNFHRPNSGSGGRFGDNQISTGTTPLFRAIMNNDLELIKVLLAKGADPNINTMGSNAFLQAAGVGVGPRPTVSTALNKELLDVLIEHKADPNTKVTGSELYSHRVLYMAPPSNEGTTALHEAARRGQMDMIKYLLDHGADANLLDGDGKKPLDVVGMARNTGAPPPAAAAGAAAPAGRGGGRGPAPPSPAAIAEIRALLQTASAKK
ncbi:MAG: ankyrin repeat domain-containing protein [Acidobacteriota bacterium]